MIWLYIGKVYIIFIYEKQPSWENFSWLVGLFVCLFVCFSIRLNISSLSLLDWQVSTKKHTDIFKGISFLWAFTFLLLLAEFSLFFLLQVMCLGDDHFEWTLRSDQLATWTWMSKSHQIWDFSGIISWSTISVPFSLSSPSRTPMMCRLFLWMLPHSSHRFFHTWSFLFSFGPWLGNLNGLAF